MRLKVFEVLEWLCPALILVAGLKFYNYQTGGLPATATTRAAYLGTMGDFLSPFALIIGAATLIIDRFRIKIISQIELLKQNLNETINDISQELKFINETLLVLKTHALTNAKSSSNTEQNEIIIIHKLKQFRQSIDNYIFSNKGVPSAFKYKNKNPKDSIIMYELILEMCVQYMSIKFELSTEIDKYKNHEKSDFYLELVKFENEFDFTGIKLMYLLDAINRGKFITFDYFKADEYQRYFNIILDIVKNRRKHKGKREVNFFE